LRQANAGEHLLIDAQRDIEELNRQKQISGIFDFNPAPFFF